MLARAMLVVLAAFWVTMNVLLWRSEYGKVPSLGSRVPARIVWDKILTAPDSSSLTIFRRGKKLGFCHWISSVSEDLTKMSGTEAPPEGMVPQIQNYRLELNGNVVVSDAADRLRFDSHINLGKNRQWKEFAMRLNWHTDNWEVRSVAAENALHFNWQEDGQKFSRVFRFAELEHPEALLQEFGGPFAVAALGGLGLGEKSGGRVLTGSELRWEARYESIKLGHASIRAYRLQLNLLDHFAAVVFVSRVGEILRVELPDEIVLTNDQLGSN
jgi:hypothetical protein